MSTIEYTVYTKNFRNKENTIHISTLSKRNIRLKNMNFQCINQYKSINMYNNSKTILWNGIFIWIWIWIWIQYEWKWNEMKMNEKETKMFGKKRKRRFQINIFIEQIYLFCFQMSLQKRTFSNFFIFHSPF